MRIRNQEDFLAGIMFAVFGFLFLFVSTDYPRGTASNMGAGYVPFALGAILTILGLAIAAGACLKAASIKKVERFHWRPIMLVAVPIIVFGILLPKLGLVLSILLLVAISSLASAAFTWRSMAANAVALAALSWIIFVWLLRLPFTVWPSF